VSTAMDLSNLQYNFEITFLILSRKNVSYASLCPSIGVPIGMFLGSVCFTLLVSEQFNVKYLGTATGKGGIITMKSTEIKSYLIHTF